MSDCKVEPCALCKKREAYAKKGRCYDCERGICEEHKAKKKGRKAK